MIYTVIWIPTAQADLATLWTQATDRSEVTLAADHLDSILRINPYSQSEERAGGSRVMAAGVLWVAYDVSDEDCLGDSLGRVANRPAGSES
jgi:hypothetical protein